MFDELKNKIKELIKENKDKEISNKTKYNSAGIYLLYVDDFSDNKIIPFYIGQTVDLQKRYKKHLTELMALNRLNYNIYKEMFFDAFYDGSFKTCKIFKYMVEHNCTLSDFHMLVLEEMDKELLEEKEQEYFKKYFPAFLGFNQMNTISMTPIFASGSISKKEYLNYLVEDSISINNFFDYGFSKTNYALGFHKTIDSIKSIVGDDIMIPDILKQNIADLAIKGNVKRYDKYKMLIPKIRIMENELKEDIENIKIELSNYCKPKLDMYFRENELKSKEKYNDVIRYLIIENNYLYESFEKYIKRKKAKENIMDIFLQDKKIKELRESYKRYNLKLVKVRKLLRKIMYINIYGNLRSIFPNIKYDKYPLKDKYVQYEFNKDMKNKNNVCSINIEFTNHGKVWYYGTSPIKVDYLIKIEDKYIEKKDIFLSTCLDNFLEQEKYLYVEKDYSNNEKFYKNKFDIYMTYYRNNNNMENENFDNYISTNMEFATGINEWTLLGKEKRTLNSVLQEISEKINEDTKIIYTTSGYKKLLLINESELDDLKHNLKNKLLKSIR